MGRNNGEMGGDKMGRRRETPYRLLCTVGRWYVHLMSCSLATQPYVITFVSAGQDKLTLLHGVFCVEMQPPHPQAANSDL